MRVELGKSHSDTTFMECKLAVKLGKSGTCGEVLLSLEHQFPKKFGGLHPTLSNSMLVGREMCTFNKIPQDSNAAGPGTTL